MGNWGCVFGKGIEAKASARDPACQLASLVRCIPCELRLMIRTFTMTADSPSFPDAPQGTESATRLLGLGFRTAGLETLEGHAAGERAGAVIGRYELIEPLGEGGFGVVWRAQQHQPIQREVALKVIKPGLDSRDVIVRFETERQALALMDHPNIAAVLDAGTTADGRPYFVMELVHGTPITEFCDQRRLGLRERLKLFIPVCLAVQHAHQKAVLHRDLKPSNLLVTECDGQAVPKVIDFGIAKALGSAAEALTAARFGQTAIGTIVGTPQYMSPEQAGSCLDVDTRSDVYSLGVVLCELLTGQTQSPAEPTDFATALHWIRDGETVKPSTLVQSNSDSGAQAANNRNLEPARLVRELRGDLDWITLKALEKDRARRYETATALARDLQRHLDQQTVSAAAPTWRYQLGKFARRQRVALIAAGLIFVALIAGTVVSLWQAARAERSRVEASSHYAQAREAVEKYLAKVSDHPRLKSADFTDLQRELLETALPFYERMSHYQGDDPKLNADRGWAVWQLAKIYQATGQLEKAEAAYDDAIKQQQALIAAAPDDLPLQKALGFQHNELGLVQRKRGKSDECLVSYAKAVSIQEGLVAQDPENAEFQHSLGTVMINHAISLDLLKRSEDSQRVYVRAWAILRDLVERYPARTNYWGTTGDCLASLGALHLNTGHWKEAEFVLKQAVECHELTVVENPQNRIFQNMLGVSLSNLGVALFQLSRHEEAEQHLRRALVMQQRLAADFPSIPSYRDELMNTQKSLSVTLYRLGKVKESDALQETVSQTQVQIAANHPNQKEHTEELAKIYSLQAARAFERKDWDTARDRYQRVAAASADCEPHLRLCQIALKTKDHASAVKHAAEYVHRAPAVWQSYDFAAQRLCEALGMIQKDAKLESHRREQAASECADQIVLCLQKYVTVGGTGLAVFDQGEHAAYLRGRHDYQTLLKTQIAPPKNSPTNFYFDYQFDNPGPRVWTRDGMMWTETAPGGASDTFTVIGPVVVGGVQGSQLEKNGVHRLTVFVPDLGTPTPMILKMKKADGSWSRISEMKDVK